MSNKGTLKFGKTYEEKRTHSSVKEISDQKMF